VALQSEWIRENILHTLYHIHRSAKSMKQTVIGILDLRRELKNHFGYERSEVINHLSYLIERGWVKRVVEEREFTTPRGATVHPRSERYKISPDGIDYLEGPLKFQKQSTFAKLNLKKIKNVVMLHDQPIHIRYREARESIEILQRKVLEAKDLAADVKLDALMDLSTLQCQISKPNPDSKVLRHHWKAVKKSLTFPHFQEWVKHLERVLSKN